MHAVMMGLSVTCCIVVDKPLRAAWMLSSAEKLLCLVSAGLRVFIKMQRNLI